MTMPRAWGWVHARPAGPGYGGTSGLASATKRDYSDRLYGSAEYAGEAPIPLAGPVGAGPSVPEAIQKAPHSIADGVKGAVAHAKEALGIGRK
jgi:hypothetical protein